MTNNAGASIAGGQYGILAGSGFADVTNSGSITGTTDAGIFAGTNATVTNHAGASIAGGSFGIRADTGVAVVTNSGSIIGTTDAGVFAGTDAGIFAGTNATVTNNGASAIIRGAQYGIYTKSNATVTNSAGATIAGGIDGIRADRALPMSAMPAASAAVRPPFMPRPARR